MGTERDQDRREREQRRIDEENTRNKNLSDESEDDLPERPTGEMRPERKEKDK